ncbi:MAG: hypothetical protein R2939_12470 [Kofleriaceae bacterium]
MLADTYGVIVYQEQVMQIAQVLAGYLLGKADPPVRWARRTRRSWTPRRPASSPAPPGAASTASSRPTSST